MTSSRKEISVFFDYEGLIFGVSLKKSTNYEELVSYVKKKYEINLHSDITFTYEQGSRLVRIHDDDDDVNFFINNVGHKKGNPHTIFIQKKDITSSPVKKSDLDPQKHDIDDNNNSPIPKQETLDKYEIIDWEQNTLTNIGSPPEDIDQYMIEEGHSGESSKELFDRTVSQGDRFDSKELLMRKLGEKALLEGYQFKPRKSDPFRYDVICVHEGCGWKIISNKLTSSNEWIVKKVNDHHTCPRNQIGMHHRNATAKLVGHLLQAKLKENTTRIYKGKDIQDDINSQYNIDITYKQACRSKNVALEAIAGCPVASFAQLPYYCHNLMLTNDGTVTHIETDDEKRFKQVFIAFGVSIRSFKDHMRPLLIIDGAHLKGPFQGTNLTAVGMDGNNQIIPIATGVSQAESAESWTWFLNHLKECIGENPELAIISDRHAGILSACAAVFPNAFHGYCCRHLMMNCKLSGDVLESTYWKMCQAYLIEDFNNRISEIRGKRPQAYKTLIDAGVDKWSRAHCTSNRYNYMTSNSVESINALTKERRKLPITNLMEWFRKLVQKWYCSRRQKYKDAQPKDNELSNWAKGKINKRWRKGVSWTVTGIEKFKIYQVDDTRRIHTVEIYNYSCTCRVWQLSGLPCAHALAICRVLGLTEFNHMAQGWFKKATLKATYQGMVYPVGEVSSWQRPNYLQVVRPPIIGKKQPGRPKNKDRIKSQGEEKLPVKCGKCGNRGHNRQTCREPLPSKKAKTCDNEIRQGEHNGTQQSTSYSLDVVNLDEP